MAREALGRGLRALLEGTEAVGEAELMQLPVSQVRPNPYQPRQHFDTERLQELASSLQTQGLLQPIVVRRQLDGFELIAGERRWRAAHLAGLETIPALVRRASDEEVLALALLENLQREDLNPLEEARAYQRLQTEFHLRQEDVAQHVGKDRSSIANALRLLKLPPVLQEDLEAGRLTMGHARALLALESEEEQLAPARPDSRRAASRCGRPKRTYGHRNAPLRMVAPNRRTSSSSKRRCSDTWAPAWPSDQGASMAKSRSSIRARMIYTAC